MALDPNPIRDKRKRPEYLRHLNEIEERLYLAGVQFVDPATVDPTAVTSMNIALGSGSEDRESA